MVEAEHHMQDGAIAVADLNAVTQAVAAHAEGDTTAATQSQGARGDTAEG